MAKTFLREKEKAAKPVSVNLLGDLLGDDADDIKEVEQPSPVEPPPAVREVKAKETTPAPPPTAREVKKVEKPTRAEYPKQEPTPVIEKVDKRKVDDKKEVFTNSLRLSILNEINEVMPSYRRAVDLDYNFAQFLEDAAKLQIKAMRAAIK